MPSYEHKQEECDQCLLVAAHGGPEAVANHLSPVYPCVLKCFDGVSKNLLSHHPFSINGDPENRIERLVILIKKLLLKMVLSDHKVMQRCSAEMIGMISTMDHNRLMMWKIRKCKPVPEAAVWMRANLEMSSDRWNALLALLRPDEYFLSDDHFRIFDTCAILYTVLDYIDGPVTLQKDFKNTDSMFPEEYKMGPLLSKAENSTFLATVDKLLDALEHELIPYPEVVRIVCGGEVERRCSICDQQVTVTEVIHTIKKRINRVACFFNTMNMRLVRCASPFCDYNLEDHPSRVGYLKWYHWVWWAFERYQENLCHFCFKLSPHGVVHRQACRKGKSAWELINCALKSTYISVIFLSITVNFHQFPFKTNKQPFKLRYFRQFLFKAVFKVPGSPVPRIYSFCRPVHRCGKCLTKVYCSKVCQQEDWKVVHSKICKGKGVQRKLKGRAKEREEAGNSAVRDGIQKTKDNHLERAVEGGYFDPHSFFQYERMLQDMKQCL